MESSVELMTLHLGQGLWLRLQFLQDILSVCLSDAEVGGRRREPGNEEEKKKVEKSITIPRKNKKYCGSKSVGEAIEPVG